MCVVRNPAVGFLRLLEKQMCKSINWFGGLDSLHVCLFQHQRHGDQHVQAGQEADSHAAEWRRHLLCVPEKWAGAEWVSAAAAAHINGAIVWILWLTVFPLITCQTSLTFTTLSRWSQMLRSIVTVSRAFFCFVLFLSDSRTRLTCLSASQNKHLQT